MTIRSHWKLIPLLALSLGACKKKDEAKAPEVPAAVAQAPSPKAPAPVVANPQISAQARADKLGFVKHLPQDTEVVLAYHNGTRIASKVKAGNLWKLIEEQMGGPIAEFADNPDEPPAQAQEDPANSEALTGPAALFGTEFTLALGKSTGVQTENLLTLNRRMTYFQMRAMAKAFSAAVKAGDPLSLGESLSSGLGSDLAKDLLKDPQSGIPLLDKMRMPPIYMAFKTAESGRPAAAQQLAATVANVGMLGDMVEPAEAETAACKFQGFKILGSKISASMAADRESMDKELDAATTDQVITVMAKKDLVVLSGTVGEYVVLFVGASVEDLQLTSDVNHSLAGSDALGFADAYAGKEIAAVVYGQKEAMDTLINATGGLAAMANGLSDGIAGSDGLGDTRDLQAMFKIVVEREAALRKLAGNDALGTVAFFEEGLKIESFGGMDQGMVNWKYPNKLAALGDAEDVVLFANMTTNPAYDEKAGAYAEALLETGYAMAMKVAEAPLESEQLAEFKEMAKLFDGKFRPDMVALWDVFSNDFSDGLGHECAMVVDLKGAAPAVPGLPQAVVDNAKVPRVSLIAPVTNRAKLSGAWDKMSHTLTGTLAKISELTGEQIPMQKPLSSEKNDNITWFFPMPFFNDDFLPSVTVGDKWFVASSSKKQALDLIDKASVANETRDGFFFRMNFKALESYSKDTLKVIDENSVAITGKAIPEDQKRLIKSSILMLGDLDELTVHSRREGPVLHSSIHFKTR
jgi:hypothetical protein